MYCPACGHGIEPGQKFCQDCGRSLADVTDTLKIASTREPPADLGVEPDAGDRDHDHDHDHAGDDTTTMPVVDERPGGSLADVPEAPNLPDRGELPTREMHPTPPIPEPDWATRTADTPIVTSGQNHQSADASWSEAASAATSESPTSPLDIAESAPPVDITATTQVPVQPHVASTTRMDAFPTGHTDEQPAVFDGPGDIHDYPRARDPFTLKLVFVLAFFGAIAVLMAAIADVIDIRTSAPVDGIATGIRTLDTLGTNLAVAGFLGATVMALGGLLACFGFRWGAGLAGGAGLALTGWAAMVVGLAELRIASAESITRQTADIAFTLRVTRDLGFWLTVAVGVIGVLVFIASLRSIGTGGRPALNPWIGALGAVAGVVLTAGPLLPEGNATFANNFRSASTRLDLPTAYFAGRVVQLALIGGAIVLGLLIVRAYGLGLAAGSVSVAFWMWLSSLLDMGSFPLGIAAGNFGASNSEPHAVTTVGMALTLLMLVVAAVLAIVGTVRHRRAGF